MGREARCMAELPGWQGEGKVQLETDDFIFRGATRLKVPLAEVSEARASDGWLEITHPGGWARFDLGDAAEWWAHSIRNPRTRIDKLGVKATSKVAVEGVTEVTFFDELRACIPHIGDSAAGTDLDLVFLQVDDPDGLARVSELRERIAQNGGIWVITPKGRPELGHDPIVAAAKAAGLIDTKAARFSDTHTALKLVIPKSQRRPIQT